VNHEALMSDEPGAVLVELMDDLRGLTSYQVIY
jgi:hypothetical protein